MYRQIPNRGGSKAGQKYVYEGSLLQRTFSLDRKPIAISRMHGDVIKHMWEETLLFWVVFGSQIHDKFLAYFRI